MMDSELITQKGGYWGRVQIQSKILMFQTVPSEKPETPEYLFGCVSEMLIKGKTKKKEWLMKDIKEVHSRRFLLQEIAIELFTTDNKSYFINLFDVGKQSLALDFLNKLGVRTIKNRREELRKSGCQEKWIRGEISNFTYLMHLNSYASRSFNDINQYFVFPWVLKDYESSSIDLSRAEHFRDLSKPIGALEPNRLKSAWDRYDTRLPGDREFEMLFGTHYSHSTIVLNYLVRIEPFAYLHYNLQNSKIK